ncbi:MAG: hypothetical protein QOK37_1073 [Thermoanaerobaculia bacterium]|jgi:membrane-bound lytic murein transglycosylase B|nr:hypothetical protein [Thermoanaerobaculia bacterium]
MKKLLTLAVFLVAIAGLAEDSPLVKAAKASSAKKKQTATKKTITNADVKKSAVKSSGATASATAAPHVAAAAIPASPLDEQDKLLHARADAQKRTDDAQTKVSELEKELDRLEQAYYAENDPNYRDKTIAGRFDQTKLQLETARKELAEAREALEKLKPRTPQ